MVLQKLIESYSGYNHWANKTMTNWLEKLDRGILNKEALSSFASINMTMQHMRNAQQHWLSVINTGVATARNEVSPKNDVDLVMQELLSGSQNMIDTYTAYSEDGLLAPIAWSDMEQSRYHYMMHSINHNSYHRGQVVTISRGLGVVDNIPETDYDTYLWHQQNDARK